ncbi:MAG: hypothetical protein KIS95_11650 [Anaerolineae bacterium]|nr:hypothetical protein [Anaerolineae bacterium]
MDGGNKRAGFGPVIRLSVDSQCGAGFLSDGRERDAPVRAAEPVKKAARPRAADY